MDKSLPADINAERAVLGSALLDRDATAVVQFLKPKHFYLEKHGVIWGVICEQFNRGVPPDLITIKSMLADRDQLDLVGGIPYLMELSNSTPTSVHIEHYAKIVFKHATRRLVIIAGGKIAGKGYDHESDVDQIIQESMAELLEISTVGEQAYVTDDEIYDEALAQLKEEDLDMPLVPILKTGYVGIDDYHNLMPGQVAVFSARPSMGKSTVLQWIRMQALLQEWHVVECSAEMGRMDLLNRMYCARTGIPLSRLESNRITPAERTMKFEAIMEFSKISQGRWALIDHGVGVDVIERTVLQRKAAYPDLPCLVIIDHLTLISPFAKARDEFAKINETMTSLKNFARKHKVLVLIAVQMNRESDRRSDDKPKMSDLFGGTGIEANADKITFLYMDKESQDMRRQAITNKLKNVVVELQFIHEKNRQGPIGVGMTTWQLDTYKIEDGL